MGVPKFYRWISERYPLINQAIDDATLLPQFDNLYLDMNGVIHGATHGDGLSKSLSDVEIMHKMFSYIDTMVKITKPRKLIYFAVDGVAPRAKMNQQRSRRFRAAKDAAEARAEARASGEEFEDDDLFDSNQITPGTPFMALVSQQLKYYIRKRLRDDPAWRGLRVLFSGHEVPGEGEHKIVGWIRAAKSQPGWDPNTKHVMAGLDADLIMLALATHEPHFSLLREQIDFMGFRNSKHDTKSKTREARHVKWQLMHVGVLREYLEMDMRPAPHLLEAMPFKWDGERCVDDFVLLTALCGNDFIPHLPSLDIGEGALDQLLKLYRETLPSAGGWLLERGIINFPRVDPLLAAMGAREGGVMVKREAMMEKHMGRKRRDAQQQRRLFGRVQDPMAAAAESAHEGVAGAGASGAMEAFLEEAEADEEAAGAWMIAGSAGVEVHMRKGVLADAVGEGFAKAAPKAMPLTPSALLGGVPVAEDDATASDGDTAAGSVTASSVSAVTAPTLTEKAAIAAMSALRDSGITEDVLPMSEAEQEALGRAAKLAARPSGGGEEEVAGAAAGAAAAASGAGSGGAFGSIEFAEGGGDDTAAAAADGDGQSAKAAEVAAQSLSDDVKAAIAMQARRAPSLSPRERYYLLKFGLAVGATPPVAEHEAMLTKLRRCFGEALQWVMLYYYQGTPSWGWFFPFHYAPMVSDLVGMGDFAPYTFTLGTPFRPFQQLLGCLPAASSRFLPERYRWLMTSADSPLLDFYPDVGSIRVDMEGKKNPWEGVTIIPFIREGRMMEALARHAPDSSLTADESRRNTPGNELLIQRDPTVLSQLRSPVIVPAHIEGTSSREAWVRSCDFPHVDRCRTAARVHVDPALPGGSFNPVPPPGCVVPAVGYPTLHTLRLAPVRAEVSLNVFGHASRKESLVLAVTDLGRDARHVRSRLMPHAEEAPYLLAVDDDDEADEEEDEEAAVALGTAPKQPSTASASVPEPLGDGVTGSLLPHIPAFSVTYSAGTCAKQPERAEAALVRSLSAGSEPGAAAASASASGEEDDDDEDQEEAPLSLQADEATADEARSLLNKLVFVGWPHVGAGLLVGLSDATRSLTVSDLETGTIKERVWTPQESTEWARGAEELETVAVKGNEERRLATCGICHGPVRLVARVRKLAGMRRDPSTGNLSRTFAGADTTGDIRVPAQLLLSGHPNPDPRFLEVMGGSPVSRFAVGSLAVVLRGAMAGETGVVAAKDEATSTISVLLAGDRPAEPAFGANIEATREVYVNTHIASREAGVAGHVFGKLAGTTKVGKMRDGIDIGLNLRVRKSLYLPGFARPRDERFRTVAWKSSSSSAAARNPDHRGGGGGGLDGGWEYSAAAVQVIKAYKQEFPRVIAALTAKPDARWLEVSDVGGGPMLERLLKWKRQLAISRRPLAPLNTSVMDSSSVQLVQRVGATLGAGRIAGVLAARDAAEEAADCDGMVAALAARGLATSLVTGLSPQSVFVREEEGYGVGDIGGGEGMRSAIAHEAPLLGARVCNLADSRARVGLRGSVVAVHGDTGYVEVVWDAPVDGGSTLNGLSRADSTGSEASAGWSSKGSSLKAVSLRAQLEGKTPAAAAPASTKAKTRRGRSKKQQESAPAASAPAAKPKSAGLTPSAILRGRKQA